MQTPAPEPKPPPSGDSLATRASLLGRLQNWEDHQSWAEFSQTYSRLIRAVAVKSGLSAAEAQDVEQETMLSVAKTIQDFEANPARGSFKSWLLNLTRWRIADQYRRRPTGPGARSAGDATATGTATVERVAGPDELAAAWESEWKRNILETALARVGRKVQPKHLQIFDLYAQRHWPATQVARELGVTLVQVYLVNHRLTKLLKQEVAFLRKQLE